MTLSTKTLNHGEYLVLKGLWIQAKDSLNKVRELEKKMADVLDSDSENYCDQISDILYEDGTTVKDLNEVLTEAGIEFETK